MRTVNIDLCEITTRVIFIGMEGEQDHTQVVFDASPILNDYPDATVALSVKPPVGNIYPVAVTKDGTKVVWNVSAADCANDGDGEYQITFTNGTEIIKTFIGYFRVFNSIVGNGTAPTPVQEWLQAAQEALGELNDLSASAHDLEYGEDATAEIESVGGHKNINIGVPGGKPGTDGTSPVITVTDIEGGHRLTITDAEGAHTVDVMDGEKGDPGTPGGDGFSPIITVTDITGGHRLTIETKTGTQTVDVLNGTPGQDGYSPTATVTKSGDTTTITITDKNGTTTAQVKDGDPEDLIDDTEPALDKTFSSSKISGEIGSLKSAINGIEDDIGTVPTGETVEGQIGDLQTDKADIIISSASGAVAHFEDGADNLPMRSVVAQIVPVQAGSGDPSPSNVRPISGVSAVNVWRTGKNLYDITKATVGYFVRAGGVSAGHPLGELTKNDNYTVSEYIPVVPNTKYTYKIPKYVTAGSAGLVYYSDKTIESAISGVSLQSQNATPYTFTTPATCHYVRFSYDHTDGDNVQFEVGETATDYAAYTGTSYPVSWQTEAGTVYGGELDVTTGVLKVDRILHTFVGTESWYFFTGTTNDYVQVVLGNFGITAANYEVVSNYLTNVNSSSTAWNGYAIPSNDWVRVYVPKNEFADNTAWKAYLASNNLQCVFKVAPITYQLTPTEIRTLLGTNNIWADTGDTSVTYRADTKKYVEKHYVTDVQVNGTSVLSNGVANVPIATTSNPGSVYFASSDHIKAGDSSSRTISTNQISRATFYGLAKAAGADMASLPSVTVGQYPETQKVAIQKMLGIYEAPWQLIRDDSQTNATEADVEIAVDDDGNAFSLTDAILCIEIPVQESEASIGTYGSVYFQEGDKAILYAYLGTITVTIGSKRYAYVRITQTGGMYQIEYIKYAIINSNEAWVSHTSTMPGDNAGAPIRITSRKITKIIIKSLTGKMNYKLYGRRTWTA